MRSPPRKKHALTSAPDMLDTPELLDNYSSDSSNEDTDSENENEKLTGSNNDQHTTPIVEESTAVTAVPKRKHKQKKGIYTIDQYLDLNQDNSLLDVVIEPEPETAKKITYILSIFAASEVKKAVAKRVAKNYSVQLGLDELWDTVKAQLLVKISMALNPPVLDFAHYDVMFHIPHVLPKPGMSLAGEDDYEFLLQCAHSVKNNTLIINLSITKIAAPADKENIPEADGVDKTKSKKKVCLHILTSLQLTSVFPRTPKILTCCQGM